jgi:sterol desaturase/sphingolipid hydroxylase (fatty acid hydroxylase superfamily)
MKKTFLKIFFLSTIFLTLFFNTAKGVEIESPIRFRTIEEIVDKTIDRIFGIGIILAPLMVVIGGIYILAAGGDPNKVSKGKEVIKWAIVGLAIILFSKGIQQLIKQILT